MEPNSVSNCVKFARWDQRRRAPRGTASSLASLAGPIRIALAAMALLGAGIGTARAACDYYAAPGGTGNGLSMASPFKVSSFWPLAGPGKTLCLMDGTYAGDTSMILPPQGLNGASGAPITVRALNDGKALITGQGGRQPVQLYHNDWFVIDGINACCSSASVVMLAAAANHNVVRRVAAWDAGDNNSEIFGVHYSNFNLLEDVAGWGTARKIFQMSQGGDNTTIRRAWGRWERSTVVGPKMTYALAYNNYYLNCENCLGTWSGQGMPQTYVLLDYYGQPWTGYGAGTYTNHDVDQPYGIFSIDAESGDKNAHVRLLGSLAYVLPTDDYRAGQAVFVTQLDSVEIRDTAAYIAPGTNPSVRPFGLYGLDGADAQSLIAANLTAFGGAASLFEPSWLTGNIWTSALAANAYDTGESVFNTLRGANLFYRYQEGTRTSQPLWPWPMNQRIKDAMALSGRSPVDVTTTVESLFGPVPLVSRQPVIPPARRRPVRSTN